MRRPFVVGNWKMNNTLTSARALVEALRSGTGPFQDAVDIGIAPPSVLLMPMSKAVAGSTIQLGAQNVYCEDSGAYTGEISPPMLVDAGCRFVIVGHSERRHIFGESGELLRKKAAAALNAGLHVIYCIGETLEQRQQKQTNAVLEAQLEQLDSRSLDWGRLTVAYEPVWAIGTGHNATPEQAQEAHHFVRGWLTAQGGADTAERIRIQYGGSVKPSNAAELLGRPDVDGALVGGASLKAQDFLAIIEAAAGVPH